MPADVKKYAPVFLAPEDEVEFTDALLEKHPDLAFIVENLWATADPPTAPTLVGCSSPIVYLWDQSMFPTLPHLVLPDGMVRGPTSGVVIQLIRCRLAPDLLTSGDIGVGFKADDQPMRVFTSTVWSILRKLNTKSPLCSVEATTRKVVNRGIRDYIVGRHAHQLASDGLLLKHFAAPVYYTVETS